jgi:hypothetical protein
MREGSGMREISKPTVTVLENKVPKNPLILKLRNIDRLDEIQNLEKDINKDSGKHQKNKLEGIIAKITEFGYRGMKAFTRHPFSPHPLGRQNNEIENAQLTQSDHETRLMNHGLAFQFQDAFEKAASCCHFVDSKAFQTAKALALGALDSMAKIDHVQRQKEYLYKIFDGKTTLGTDEQLEKCLQNIKDLKKYPGLTLDSQLQLRYCTEKIKSYADNINKQAGGIKEELRHISETRQLVETLIEYLGVSTDFKTPQTLENLIENLKTYEKALKDATELKEKFLGNLKKACDSNC